jgi:hypothetical protein
MTLQQLIDRLQELQAEVGPGKDPKVLVDHPDEKSFCYAEITEVCFRHGFQLVAIAN